MSSLHSPYSFSPYSLFFPSLLSTPSLFTPYSFSPYSFYYFLPYYLFPFSLLLFLLPSFPSSFERCSLSIFQIMTSQRYNLSTFFISLRHTAYGVPPGNSQPQRKEKNEISTYFRHSRFASLPGTGFGFLSRATLRLALYLGRHLELRAT